jgi:hypothetical protein
MRQMGVADGRHLKRGVTQMTFTFNMTVTAKTETMLQDECSKSC